MDKSDYYDSVKLMVPGSILLICGVLLLSGFHFSVAAPAGGAAGLGVALHGVTVRAIDNMPDSYVGGSDGNRSESDV